MEELKPAMGGKNWMASLHNIVKIEGRRTVHLDDNGEFDFESVTLKTTDPKGNTDEFGLYSNVEGALTEIPVYDTE